MFTFSILRFPNAIALSATSASCAAVSLALRRAVVRPVGQSLQALRVIAMNPVAQGLPVHARRPRRLGSVPAFQNQRQRQHPTRRPASLVRLAAARKPRASRSVRVIAIVISDPPALRTVIQTHDIGVTHVRVNGTDGWYYSQWSGSS